MAYHVQDVACQVEEVSILVWEFTQQQLEVIVEFTELVEGISLQCAHKDGLHDLGFRMQS